MTKNASEVSWSRRPKRKMLQKTKRQKDKKTKRQRMPEKGTASKARQKKTKSVLVGTKRPRRLKPPRKEERK